MQILFITSNRLGDGVLSTGILNHLTLSYPQASFTIAAGPVALPLFADWPRVDQLICMTKKRFSAHWAHLWRQCVGQKWDMVIDIRGSLVSYGLFADRRYVWGKKYCFQGPKVEQLARFLNLNQTPAPSIPLSKKRFNQSAAFNLRVNPGGAPLIGLGPVANWHGKEWPFSSFVQLMAKLTAPTGPFPGARPVIFGAPNEQERLRPLVQDLKAYGVIDLVGQLEILDIAAFLHACDFFIGNDSGLMHLSAAVDCPTLGLFGPSPHEIYAPYGPQGHFIRTPEDYQTLKDLEKKNKNQNLMGHLSVERVYQKIVHLVAQTPRAQRHRITADSVGF